MISLPKAASLIRYSQELQLFFQMMVLEEKAFEIPRKVSEVGLLGNISSKRFSFLLCFLVMAVSGMVLDKESCSEQCRDSYPTCGDVKNLQEC